MQIEDFVMILLSRAEENILLGVYNVKKLFKNRFAKFPEA